jgi:DNA-binding ferritin-like protein
MSRKSIKREDKIEPINKHFINRLFELQLTIKTFHWMTSSFAKHKATDELYGELNNKIDTFVETYMGIYGRPNIKNEIINIKNMNDDEFVLYLKKTIKYLENDLPINYNIYTDLSSIKDEMIGLINKTFYLFTMS